MKNFEEELDELAESKDLNLARQKRFELLVTSLRGKKSSLLKNSKLWDQSGANTLNLHLFHCQNVNPILEGCIAEKVDPATLRDIIGTSLLHVAARTNDLKAAQTLIELDADVNGVNMSGISPLHSALASGNAEIAELLITKGAKVNQSSLSWRLFRVPFPGLPKDIWCCNKKSEKMPGDLKRMLEKEESEEPPRKKIPQSNVGPARLLLRQRSGGGDRIVSRRRRPRVSQLAP